MGVPISLPSTPSDLSEEDLNGDAHVDLAIADQGADDVMVLFGHGDGSFDPPISVPALSADVVQLADIDGDGRLDLIVGNYKALVVVHNNGDKTFGTPDVYPVVKATTIPEPLSG